MLYSIQNENIYTVPRGYFENLGADVLDNVLPTQTKVVVMTTMRCRCAPALRCQVTIGVVTHPVNLVDLHGEIRKCVRHF